MMSEFYEHSIQSADMEPQTKQQPVSQYTWNLDIGCCNLGPHNIGCCNTGSSNVGCINTGYKNYGCCNTGSKNNGCCGVKVY